MKTPLLLVCLLSSFLFSVFASAQIGQRFPSERKVVVDPVTGVPLTFLTSQPGGDSKIYPTHAQWTSDGEWVIFRSNRVRGQAMAVNEKTGDIVQVTEHGYVGMLCVGVHSMRLFHIRPVDRTPPPPAEPGQRPRGPRGPMEIVAIDLDAVFADSAAGKMKPAEKYEHVFGTIPEEIGGGGDLAIDATEEWAYFRVNSEEAAKHLPEGTKIEDDFGPRNMGAGPAGIAKMNLKTGEVSVVTAVPFQVGHVQSNPWVPGEIVFCWETGGKAPQRMWTVNSDGTGLRPLYPEQPFDWITHEVVVTKDEIAFAMLGHRRIGTDDEWGVASTRAHPTGLAILNLRTNEVYIAGQTKSGSGLWHVHASPDGRWAVGDDFARNLWLIDRRTNEMRLLTTGHKPSARDHVHPTFKADSTAIQIQSAMLAEDDREMNICIVPVPEDWLARTYDENIYPPADYGTRNFGRP